MGRKLDALLGRNFKTAKFKPLVNLALSRLAVLKSQRQIRCSQARSDVVQLLQLGHHDRALLRVEQVIKEQNMLDVFVMLEGYCNLLIERVHLMEQDRGCPEELKEAISGLIFASSRCGEFPELLEIRAVFVSRYGKEFATRAIELRNNCGVSTKLIQKLSTRQPDLESRMKELKEIAAENTIVLQVEEISSVSSKENVDSSKKQNQTEPVMSDGFGNEEGFSDSMEARQKYKDVADAAQAAFESAAYAAAAARAAVELSRSDFHDPDNQNSPRTPQRRVIDRHESDSKDKEIQNGSQAKEEVNQSKKASEINTTNSFDDVDPLKLLDKDIILKDSDDEGSHYSNPAMIHRDGDQIASNLHSGVKPEVGFGHSPARTAEGSGIKAKQKLAINKEAFSMRTRQPRGH
ncbi:hypothetical protein SLEP1_g51181 [Rubroshorea leprosula]|uniref:IST1-like protein n=1 Tax=Rubroshorea leprosula TaxID=152421 RepID=A0AAV5M380_9ROSI|nr:hypothetical protein SLEP1_g51181 [Rubroshorea leprosula]